MDSQFRKDYTSQHSLEDIVTNLDCFYVLTRSNEVDRFKYLKYLQIFFSTFTIKILETAEDQKSPVGESYRAKCERMSR